MSETAGRVGDRCQSLLLVSGDARRCLPGLRAAARSLTSRLRVLALSRLPEPIFRIISEVSPCRGLVA